jgi:hypothetical protein
MNFPVDHIVYAAPSLEEGMDAIEKLIGVRPVNGGRHPQYGTHNALLSLGDSIYLEVIAPDPGLASPENGRLLQEHFTKDPHIATWVLRSGQIEKDAGNAREKGISLGGVSSGQREKPDGTILSWQLTDPYALPMDGAIPFLISWGNTPHPAGAVPKAGQLTGISITHPDPATLLRQLNILGVDLKVSSGLEVKIRAHIDTGSRVVTIE